jgi:AcrR family transcriptional regulator
MNVAANPVMDEKSVLTSQRAIATRNRILDGAISSFADLGESTTIEQILRATGVGRTTFYRHFSNLEDVLSQAVVRDLDVLLANVNREQALYDSIEDKIIEGMMYSLREFNRHPLGKLVFNRDTVLLLSRIGTYEEHFNALGAHYAAPVYRRESLSLC